MAEDSVLYEQGDLRIVVKNTVDPQAITLLQQTVYGTTGVRYRQSGQEIKLPELADPFFFYLYQQEQLMGMYCLDKRAVRLSFEWNVAGYYGRYLTVDARLKGLGYGQLLKNKAIDYVNRVNGPSPSSFVFYSYIEENNTRSIAISRKAGFNSIAVLRTYFFRRYSPVKDARFVPLLDKELPEMRNRLAAYYSEYTFRTLAQIGYHNNYFVIKEKGEIVAGVQANPAGWVMKRMPGFRGWLLMKVVPLLKAARRFFNPSQFSFVVLEGVYLRHDRAELLPVLLESVLAHFGLNSAMWQIDENDPHNRDIRHNQMGFFSGFRKGVRTHVMVKPVRLSTDQLNTQAPQYVSCFDYA